MHQPPQGSTSTQDLVNAALEADQRGYTPVPITAGDKRPALAQWQHLTYADEAEIKLAFEQPRVGGIGLILGKSSGGLVDVDLDAPLARSIARKMLPRTPMMTGRAGTRNSHYWYQTKKDLPNGTRQYKLPDGSSIVELRSTNGQTLIPPSIHPSGEPLIWEGEPWGGEAGPAPISGNALACHVAFLAMATVLIEGWPTKGSRHEAYLALAGGLMRLGRDSITPHWWWQEHLPGLTRIIAHHTHDDAGGEARINESFQSTIDRIREGGMITGWTRLAEIIGDEFVTKARRYSREAEKFGGCEERPAVSHAEATYEGGPVEILDSDSEERDPLRERMSVWEGVDIEPYLRGEIPPVMPTLLYREDDKPLFYPGRVNCLYGAAESGKSWLALFCAIEAISLGQHVIYVDCEDDPQSTLSRLMLMGVGPDDLLAGFTYIRPEAPLARLMFNRWGQSMADQVDEEVRENDRALARELDRHDPGLIVLDGLTVLYGLHGLDTNDATHTDRISGWMKSLTRNGRSTVLVIDHIRKDSSRGSLPLGSQHKTAMVQGTALQVWPIDRPRPGILGTAELIIGKDRPGRVREVGNEGDPQVAAELEIDSRVPGQVQIRLLPPKDAKKTAVIGHDDGTTRVVYKNAEQEAKLLRVLTMAGDDGISKTKLEKAVGGNKATLHALIGYLWESHQVSITQEGQTHMVRLTPPPPPPDVPPTFTRD